MICYQCGAPAGNSKKCPSCGADLELFQRVRKISNSLYNDGYYKAQVRDLSGAISSLQNSLKYNKYNIDARNLLGLVYYETGESVNALSEWVISVNLQPENNLAHRYLKTMKETRGLMDQMKQTTRKYNQAVYYCSQNSNDMAIIQLKKVIALNPNMVKAHQLLALLYLQTGKLEKAKKELKAAAKVDSANTVTFRYMKEVNRMIRLQHGNPQSQEEELVTYRNGNETVIMPKRFKENSLRSLIRYMITGLLIGACAAYFILTPSAVNHARNDMQQKILSLSEEASTAQQQIEQLTEKQEDLEKQISDAASDAKNVEKKEASYRNLLSAYMYYVQNDYLSGGDALSEVDESLLDEDSVKIYTSLHDLMDTQYRSGLYNAGIEAYSSKNYEQACQYLKKLADEDMTYENGNAVYFLALSYVQNGKPLIAKSYFRFVVNNFAGTDIARMASGYLEGDETVSEQSDSVNDSQTAGTDTGEAADTAAAGAASPTAEQ